MAYDLTLDYMTPLGDLPEAVQKEWVENAKKLLQLTDTVPLSRAFDFSLVRSLQSSSH